MFIAAMAEMIRNNGGNPIMDPRYLPAAPGYLMNSPGESCFISLIVCLSFTS